MIKILLERINGVLLLDKPAGISSNFALQRVKRLLHAAKAGHTGTLDPLATGLLPICLGEATKFSSGLLEENKTYQAVIKLGITTTTGDAEGEVIAESPVVVENEQIEKVLKQFTGAIQQIPPMYSALKHKGKALYKYARQGETIVRPPRDVMIYDLCMNRWDGATHEISITTRCSKGTYIRVLGEDIGNALGCGAHLKNLKRIAIGAFELTHSIGLEGIEELELEQRRAFLLPVDSLVQAYNKITLNNNELIRITQGQIIIVDEIPYYGIVSLYDEGNQFWGLGEVDREHKIRAARLMAQNLI